MNPPPRQSQPADCDAGPIVVRQNRFGFALFLLGGLLFVFFPVTSQSEVSWPIWLLAILAWYVPALAAVTVGIWGLLTQGIALTLDREGLWFGGFSFLKPHRLRWDEIVGVRHVRW